MDPNAARPSTNTYFALAFAAGMLVADTGRAKADERSPAANLFDPHLTMPNQSSPGFVRPQPDPSPAADANDVPAATHSARTLTGATSRTSGFARDRHAAGGSKLGTGRASWYQHKGRTASGEVFKPDGLTAAHHSLPLGSRVRVVNSENGRSVVVRINDRTNEKTRAKRPYVIDVSRRAAEKLGMDGLAQVSLFKAD